MENNLINEIPIMWTGKKTKTVSSVELKKITNEAIMDGRLPVFGIHLDGEDYVILLETDFLEIWNKLNVRPE
jgi:hypothetical protein